MNSDSIVYSDINLSTLSKRIDNRDIDERLLSNSKPKRSIVDISTDSFIKVIFKKDQNYYLFLNYVNTLDHYLNYHVNKDLIKCGQKPLNGDESIGVYFKGGNVMNYHFNNLVTNSELRELFSAFFKKSDFDFSVSIHVDDVNRYNNLKTIVYPLIIKFLKKTTDKFNEYLNQIINNTLDKTSVANRNTILLQNIKNYNRVDKNIDVLFIGIMKKIKEFISNSKVELILDLVKLHQIDKIISVQKNDNDLIINNSIIFRPKIEYLYLDYSDEKLLQYLNMQLNNYTGLKKSIIEFNRKYKNESKYIDMILRPYIEYLIDNRYANYHTYDNLLDNIIEYNFNLFVINDFYSKENLSEMIKLITEELSKLTDIYYEVDMNNPPTKTDILDPVAYINYKVNNALNVDSIGIIGRDDFIVTNNLNGVDATPLVTIYPDENSDKNVHYISGNYTIAMATANNNTVDFDLIRVKFNLAAMNVVSENGIINEKFNIPSEFIDVGINNIQTSSYNEDKECFKMPIELTNTIVPNIPVKTHQYSYFIGDLSRVLFIDGSFLPWTKAKYQKRIKRTLVLIHVYDVKNKTKLLNMINSLSKDIFNKKLNDNNIKQYALSNVLLDSYKFYNNIYDMIYIDRKFNVVKFFLKNILILNEIVKSPESLNIINHFRSYLKLTPLESVATLKTDFDTYINEIIATSDQIIKLTN